MVGAPVSAVEDVFILNYYLLSSVVYIWRPIWGLSYFNIELTLDLSDYFD
jgi:hypothetical protein